MGKTYRDVYEFGLDFSKLKSAVKDLVATKDVVINKIKPKYDRKAKFALELLGDHAVTEFYDSYSPHVYTSRREDLFHAYKFIIDDDGWGLSFGSEYMNGGHRASNETIYKNSFELGWHGGAYKSKKGDHPSPGIPWWKAPVGQWTYWLSPAAQTESPKNIIESEFNDVIEPIEQQLGDEVVSYGQPYLDKVNNIIDSML